MSKNDVLYCKGMKMDLSESDDPQNTDEKWDDSLLNAAYDRALNMASVEVAKRIAMSTNSNHEDKGSSIPQKKKKENKSNKQWSAGTPCRAIYEEDGLEYEALVSNVLNDRVCIVKFIGYDNTEQVAINTLKPSLGTEAQVRQIQEAACVKEDDSDGRQSSATSEGTKKKKKPKKKNKQPQETIFTLPEVPMPDMDKLRNMTSKDIPFPMPPVPPMQMPSHSDSDNEDNAVSSMLLSWYMSGYYTGLYQGLKRSKANKRQK